MPFNNEEKDINQLPITNEQKEDKTYPQLLIATLNEIYEHTFHVN